MTYSTDKCIKLLGYEYELPDEIILIIQKLVVKNKMKECIDDYNRKIHPSCRALPVPGYPSLHINIYRLYLKQTPRPSGLGGCIPMSWRDRLTETIECWLPENNNIYGLKCIVENFSLATGQFVWQYRLSLDDYTKADMIEVMKNHGMKFNKSKKKADLFNIFIKNKCFNIE